MTRGLLKHGDYNVLTVDWSSGSRVMYHQAVSNIRVVALEVAALINWMHTQLGQKTELVHVIGHSLGSHTAGKDCLLALLMILCMEIFTTTYLLHSCYYS